MVAWDGSLQHEVIHGHPTKRQAINDAIGSIPLSSGCPMPSIKRESHLERHRDEHLTDPIEAPEFSYFTRATWEQLGGIGKLLARWTTTLLGRLTIGPPVMVLSFLAQERRLVLANEARRRHIWATQLIDIAVVPFCATIICGMPLWLLSFRFRLNRRGDDTPQIYAEHR